MQEKRTLWHPAFSSIVDRYGPSEMTVRPEFMVATEPQRADLLLLRNREAARSPGEILRGLWKHLPRRTLVEFKSARRPPRRGDWIKLMAFTGLYDARKLARMPAIGDLAMVLVTPSWTPTLEGESQRMGWTRVSLGDGYYRIEGAPYPSFVALIDEVAEAEQDPILGVFAHETVRKKLGPVPGDAWISIMAYFKQRGVDVKYDIDIEEAAREVLSDLPPEWTQHVLDNLSDEARLKGMSDEARLKGMSPEARLKDLSREEQILALADDLLAQFPETMIQSFSAETQAEIRRRLGA